MGRTRKENEETIIGEYNLSCKGICVRYKATGGPGKGRYATGQKRCNFCEVFVQWDGSHCPCCGHQLRIKPRNKKYKEKLRDSLLTKVV